MKENQPEKVNCDAELNKREGNGREEGRLGRGQGMEGKREDWKGVISKGNGGGETEWKILRKIRKELSVKEMEGRKRKWERRGLIVDIDVIELV